MAHVGSLYPDVLPNWEEGTKKPIPGIGATGILQILVLTYYYKQYM